MPSVTDQRVLIFGDSLSSGPSSPGAQMAAVLEAHGANTMVNAVVGRSAWNFYTSREDFAQVIADCHAFHPDLVIIELGTNDIGLSPSADRAAFVRLAKDLGGAGTEVWAIGPPAFSSSTPQATNVDTVYQTMKSVFGSKLIDWRPLSRDMTTSPPRTADGVHFTAQGGPIAGARLGQAFLDAGGIGTILLVGAAVLAWAILR